jgi:gas vesicle protein
MQSVISSSTPTIPINADLTHASESAVDPLWKYQLRREHKALFEKMEAHFTKYKEEKEANLASLKQVQDQVTAVENKIEQWTTKVEAQMDKLGSDNQELREDLRNFRTVLIQPVQQQNENGRLCFDSFIF